MLAHLPLNNDSVESEDNKVFLQVVEPQLTLMIERVVVQTCCVDRCGCYTLVLLVDAESITVVDYRCDVVDGLVGAI